MPVLISDLWTPAVWVDELAEKQATFPSLLNSGIVARSQQLNEIASGPGVTANIPFFKDITDQSDEVQIENTGPTTDNGQPSGLQVATVLNRVTKNSAAALAVQVSGSDPVGQMVSALVARRLKQRQKSLLSMLRASFGVFNVAAGTAANAAGPLSAVRYGGVTAEIFIETTAGQTAANKISADVFIQSKALMGELADDLTQGVFWCHPNIRAALEVLDAASFKTGIQSGLPFNITTYRGIPIFTSEALVRVGTTSGFVYDSYILAPGIVGMGDKPQLGDVLDVASLQLDTDKDKNNQFIYDRTRFVMHLNGMKWIGTPAAQSATNTELQTVANWNLVYQTANRVGAVCLRTNG